MISPKVNDFAIRIITSFIAWMFLVQPAGSQGTSQGQKTFAVEEGAIAAINGPLFNNRPLYCNHTDAFILAGDRPFVHFAGTPFIYGGFGAAVEQGGRWKWLHEFGNLAALYRGGMMTWKMKDPGFPGLSLIMDVVPMEGVTGMAVRMQVTGSGPDSRLVWIYGGAQRCEGNLSWDYDPLVNNEMLAWKLDPGDCRGNLVQIAGNRFRLELQAGDTGDEGQALSLVGQCSTDQDLAIGEATFWENLADLVERPPGEHPLVYGSIELDRDSVICWSFQPEDPAMDGWANTPEVSFEKGLAYAMALQERIVVSTPDPRLNALASASVAAIDGLWYPPVYRHGAMLWNRRYPGWRTVFGGTMYGWHERVHQQAAFYLASQVTKADKLEPKPHPDLLLTTQHPDSRFYGKGRIALDQSFYNMQSQFFDQLIREWRWTADAQLEEILRPALELHLVWQRECFDPDGDGTYESYINGWPTDSQWYNGGGTAEETSYAFRGHRAAFDMARRAGDTAFLKLHRERMEQILKGFFQNLWISDYGHPGSYREQGGHERLHTDPWLYSIFLPVDAGLLNREQAVASLYYSEWALQNDPMPLGGRKVWTSNWVPGIWSVRPLWPGDNYHLALAYFKAGLARDGWDIFRGTFMHSAYGQRIPGNLGDPVGGTDFGDCAHTFCRTLVEGLFGYQPDLPNGIVHIAPQFPWEWDSAGIHTPDVDMEYRRIGREIYFNITQQYPSDMIVSLPVSAAGMESVLFNGSETEWELLPGFGQTLVQLHLPNTNHARLLLTLGDPAMSSLPVYLEGNIRDTVTLPAGPGRIRRLLDPQAVLSSPSINSRQIKARLSGKPGYHTVLAEVEAGEHMPQYRIYRIRILDPEGDSLRNEKTRWPVPQDAKWEMIDVANRFNGDIRTIYRQEYLSPRPNTVSVRIGTDGYSPWTFPHWKSYPPEIMLDSVSIHLEGEGILRTRSGIRFLWNSQPQNVIFTSLWDNWPDSVTIPVGRSGDAICFLVCGSTNPMQCQIPNAVIRLAYEDGLQEELELIPPVNYRNLSPILSEATAPGQEARSGYDAPTDAFCMPEEPPETLKLGRNCEAMILKWRLRPGVRLDELVVQALSQEVVVGLMGVSLMNPD